MGTNMSMNMNMSLSMVSSAILSPVIFLLDEVPVNGILIVLVFQAYILKGVVLCPKHPTQLWFYSARKEYAESSHIPGTPGPAPWHFNYALE
ncbi:hypothetical protein BJ085DRAFT_37682 [Dimargaris cristalligena]|uniref:Uncharacterized protein n=1 Tax=Dimargaris cristalligena TaxID=215637 RepID=A0A4V1J3Y5_9FUNG|nr:hypothetical protein BJ085DRAFT_37682 [Dimargaris cristalligena]|eukprot:RKP33679.1 hypothetical protein BJ085DRAFT_37682 [Dimargaris cristalligena]